MLYRGLIIALGIPCHNEESTVATVIRDFQAAIPQLDIHVLDNHSTDRTAQIAAKAGAKVISVPLRGKGNVVRRMFADIEADVFVMVDGDATYDALSVRRMVDRLIDERLDMVVGCRKPSETPAGAAAYRPGHRFGNRILTEGVAWIFGGNITDMLSGYKIFSRRYAKSFPALSRGFEIETELTVHALELRMPWAEELTAYGARPEGSQSKLATYSDGARILATIGRLYIAERPLQFYTMVAAAVSFAAFLLALPIVVEFFKTGLVPRLPTAVLCAALAISALLSLTCGLILDNVVRCRQEIKRLAYLAIPHVQPRQAS